jgi:DNA repair protein SbcC/Rad50
VKIHAIRGANLASLGDTFEVDLEGEILGCAGLFAITGPTGAGKSTILDALCLALFDAMPRLPGGNVVEIGRADDAPELKLRGNDVRSVLRRGAGVGFAEVDFTGTDGRRYRARWDVKRARGKVDGRIQAQTMTLHDLDTGDAIGRTRTEVLAEISARLGLTFDQFRRSVLLAQGDFAAFLKADAKQRSELLERMTGTELYSELSKAAHQRASIERAELDRLEDRLGEARPLDDDLRAELDERYGAAKTALAEDMSRLESTGKAVDWYGRLDVLEGAVAEAEEEFETARDHTSKALERRTELKEATVADPLRGSVDALDRAQAEAEQVRLLAGEDEQAAVRAEELADGARQSARVAAAAATAARQALDTAQPEINAARALDERLGDAEKAQRAAADALETAEPKAASAHKALGTLVLEVKTQTAAGEEALVWLTEKAYLASVAGEWSRWREALVRLQEAGDEAAAAATDLAEVESTIAEVDAELVTHLRARLVGGEPCPVCGSEEHPWDGRQRTDSELAAAAGAAVIEVDHHRVQRSELEHRLGELRAILSRSETESRRHRRDLQTALRGIPGALDEIESDPEGLAKRLEEAVSQWSDRQKIKKACDERLSELRAGEAAAEAAAGAADTELERCVSAEKDSRRKLDGCREERAGLLEGEAADFVDERLRQADAEARAKISEANDRAEGATNEATARRAAAIARIREATARESERDRLASELDGEISDSGFSLERLRKVLSRGREWIATETKALEALDSAVTRAGAVLEERRKTLDGHCDTNQPTIEADDAVAAHKAAEDEVQAARKAEEEIRFELRDDDKARARAAKLGTEIGKQHERWQLWASLKELIGSADGSKFRTFAQSLTFDVLLAYANDHLRELSPRYRLQRVPGSDLELQAVDRDMADEVRSIYSLSGGETFLASLALALGLASLSAQQTRVESLFIDEGFGSLDADTLDTAVAALDALHSLGRQVGIISHVGAMVERMGVQVAVEPQGGGRSRVEVRVG